MRKRYKELKDNLERKENDFYRVVRDYQSEVSKNEAYAERITKLNDEIDHLRRLVEIKDETIKDLSYSNLSKDHTIEFLCHEKFQNNEDIEFATIKSYRNGWEYMYLNGKKLNPTDKDDVSIHAFCDDKVSVEINSR